MSWPGNLLLMPGLERGGFMTPTAGERNLLQVHKYGFSVLRAKEEVSCKLTSHWVSQWVQLVRRNRAVVLV